MNKILLTGDRPSGKLHLGHYVGSLISRLQLQEKSEYDSYIMIADIQALTDNFSTPQQIRANVYEVLKDYIAVGLDPKKNTFFIQSQITELNELTTYLLNLVSLNRLRRNPTLKREITEKKYGESPPMGFLCYPVSQIADITLFNSEIVPVGEDQIPMIELTNDIVGKFNKIYNTNCLKTCMAYLSKTPRLIGLHGRAKASKSLGNVIFLSDSSEVIKKKVFSMYTDPTHLRASDPGKVDGNVVFVYLDAFHPSPEVVSELKKKYKKGGLGDVDLKNILNDTLQDFLAPIRKRREKIVQSDLEAIIDNGNKKARTIAQKTIKKVRSAIGVNY